MLKSKGQGKRRQKPEERRGWKFGTNEGIANQIGFESCADTRESVGEALTEESPGQPLSSALFSFRAAHSGVSTLSCQGEDHMKRYVQREFRFDASESQTLCIDGNALRENRETSMVPSGDHLPEGRSEKATSRTADMHAVEESDDLVIPAKRANKTGTPAAESVEETGSTKGNAIQLASSRNTARNV